MTNMLGSAQYDIIYNDVLEKIKKNEYHLFKEEEAYTVEEIRVTLMEDIDPEEKDIIEKINTLSTPKDVIEILKDSGWDLWSAAPFVAGLYGYAPESDNDLDTTIEAIYFLISAFGYHENWVEIFDGFST